MNFSLATEATRYHIAEQGAICYDIGKMSVRSSYECKKAATAFGKMIKSEISDQQGWCIFHNNEVYWDVPGGGLWKPQSQEICSNDGKKINFPGIHCIIVNMGISELLP